MPRRKRVGQNAIESLEPRTLLAGEPLSISHIPWQDGVQLSIAGTPHNDQISITPTASGLKISNNGKWFTTIMGSFKSIRVAAGSGNDSIRISSFLNTNTILLGGPGNDRIIGGSGNDRIYGGTGKDRLFGSGGDDTLVDIGGGSGDIYTGGAGADSFWADPGERISDATEIENSLGAIHRVDSFMAYNIRGADGVSSISVSMNLLGQKLADPLTTTTSITHRNFAGNPLFSDAGPTADDVVQGAVGDCYFLAALSAVAKVNPQYIRQSIVDLGDGTYAVQFKRGPADVFVRVDADLPTYSWGGLAYANAGKDGALWVALMEKAFAFFRYSQGTYASIEGGWMSEGFDALGRSSDSSFSGLRDKSLVDQIDSDLRAGKAVTVGVGDPAGAPLIGYHAYMVDSVVRNGAGEVTALRLRNPWGIDGAGADGTDDGYVTITSAQAKAAFMGVTSAAV